MITLEDNYEKAAAQIKLFAGKREIKAPLMILFSGWTRFRRISSAISTALSLVSETCSSNRVELIICVEDCGFTVGFNKFKITGPLGSILVGAVRNFISADWFSLVKKFCKLSMNSWRCSGDSSKTTKLRVLGLKSPKQAVNSSLELSRELPK